MIHTPVCDLLGIEAPIMCAPFGPWDQVELAVAVCDAGGFASLGTAVRPLDDLVAQWHHLRERSNGAFNINHTMRPLDDAAFAATIEFRPRAISFHMGVPADLITEAHDHEILWIQQVTDCDQAESALAAGADVLIAQGGEAGGHSGEIATMALVPQVVDLAGTTPVLAAGGIADGRGLAAALTLGAQGVNMGTRFLASTEMQISQAWKQRIIDARSQDAVKVVNSDLVMPPYSRPGPPSEPRSLVTGLIDTLANDPDSIDPTIIGPTLIEAVLNGRGDEYLPFAGQTTGLINHIRPAAEIIATTITEAERMLEQGHQWLRPNQTASEGHQTHAPAR